MKITTILTTRSKSCHVKTLHTILRLNLKCLERGVNNEIVFVNDDPYEKSDVIVDAIKKNPDKILFIDFGVGMDDDSILQVFEKHEGIGCLVFPGVKEGIDWGLFKAKVRDDECLEPNSQMGLHFDTEVGRKVSENIYVVESTSARVWIMNCKNASKFTKDKKNGSIKILPRAENMFAKFKENGMKIHAFTAAKLTMTYSHECISNILNAAGVSTN